MYTLFMSLARSLAWNTGLQIVGKMLSTGLGVVIIGLMTRYLGQDGFGAYSTANAFLQVVALLLDLGINMTFTSLLGEHAGDKKYEERCVSALFTLRALMAVVLIGLAAPLIGAFFPYPLATKLAILALTASFIFPSLNQIVNGVQQRHLRMAAASFTETIGRVVVLVGLLLAPHFGWGLVTLSWIISLAATLAFLANFLLTRDLATFRWNWDPEFWRATIVRSWPIGVSILFNLIYYKADTLILSLVRSPAEVGLYSAAYRVLEILITVPFMYAGLLLPIMSAAWAKRETERFALFVSRSVDAMSLLIAPLIVGTLILGPKLMTLIAGDDFVASGQILRILIFAIGIIYINVMFSHAIVAANIQRQMLPVYITVALVTLTGYLIFIPRYGMWAAAWLTVFSETCVTLGSFTIARRLAPFRLAGRIPLLALLAALIMAILIYPLRNVWVIWPLLVGVATYGAAVIALGAVPRELLRELLPNKNLNH